MQWYSTDKDLRRNDGAEQVSKSAILGRQLRMFDPQIADDGSVAV